MNILIVFLLLLFFNVGHTNQIGTETGLEIPRYVSLKSNDSNLRIGPSINYPIKIKYIVQNFPLKLTEEYQDWRKVIDFEKNEGWVHKSLIKAERNGIIVNIRNNEAPLYNSINGRLIGVAQEKNIVQILKCKIDWCLVKQNRNKGWIEKKFLWGVKKNEILNIKFFQPLTDYYIKSINLIYSYYLTLKE